jgi:hypothetical protein
MQKARQVFESLLRSKGLDPVWNGSRYQTANIQTKWRYFLLGWSMKETHDAA